MTRRAIVSDRFGSVPVEGDTRISFRKETKIGNYNVLHEKWNWEGIKAESLIFANNDVSKLSDEEIIKEVRESPFINEGSDITLKRSKEFTYVNFNFEMT
jgi:hypothetical protein